MTHRLLRAATSAALVLLAAGNAHAANADFQSFFLDVCSAPSGALSTRCGETPGAAGDLSGDSESSLNPSQNASHNQAPLASAQLRSRQASDKADASREVADSTTTGKFALLANAFTSQFERDEGSQQGLERGMDGDSTGFELGLDYRFSPSFVVGAILGIENYDYDFDAEAPGVNFTPASQAGSADSDNVYLTLFGSWAVGDGGYLDLSAGYEQTDGTYERNAVFQETTRTVAQTDVRVSGDADGDVTWVSLAGGYDFTRDAWSFGPYAGLLAASADLDSYAESDLSLSGLNMSFGSTERKSLLGHLGAQASYTFSTGAGVVIPQLRAEYQREFDDDAQDLSTRFILDPTETVYSFAGEDRDEDYATIAFSISAVLANGWLPFFDAAVVLGNDELDRQRFTLGLRKEF